MRAYSVDFCRRHVESFTLGTARWRKTVPVPQSWWRDYQRIHHRPCTLNESVVHIFDIERSEQDIFDANLHWMGTTGVGYVWSYVRNGSRFYTAVFEDRAPVMGRKKLCAGVQEKVDRGHHTRGRRRDPAMELSATRRILYLR